jgi:hypothetical protein
LGASVCATAADPSRASTAAIGKIRIETSIEDTFAARDSSGRNFQALQVNPENVSRRCDGHRRGTDSIQASNQSIDREFADATGGKRGNIRLLQPKHDGSLGLGKLPTFDDSPEFVNKLGLEKALLPDWQNQGRRRRCRCLRLLSYCCSLVASFSVVLAVVSLGYLEPRLDDLCLPLRRPDPLLPRLPLTDVSTYVLVMFYLAIARKSWPDAP